MNNQLNYKKLTEEVEKIAIAAGKYIRNERTNFDTGKVEQKGNHDFVSYVDKTSEKQIVTELEKLLPQAGFIAEEGTRQNRGEIYNWIIDPLDGTTNFIHGIYPFAVSIALMENNEIVSGVVYEIGLDECFSASKKGGAFLNGKQIKVSDKSKLDNCLIATGFPYSNYSKLDKYMTSLSRLMVESHGIRRIGSAATDLVYTACGRFDAFYEYGLSPWDVAAGVIIVKEAGGKISDFQGNDNYIFGKEIVAANNLVFDEFSNLIKNCLN